MIKVSITLPNNAQITFESEEAKVIGEVVGLVLRDLPRDLVNGVYTGNGAATASGATEKGNDVPMETTLEATNPTPVHAHGPEGAEQPPVDRQASPPDAEALLSNGDVAATEAPPAATEAPPAATEAPPAATEAPPAATEAPPVAAETPPVAAETPPVATEAPPVAAETPPVAAETPPVAAETPPVAAETPPVAAETPPVAAEAPPVAAETPPVAAEAPPNEAERRFIEYCLAANPTGDMRRVVVAAEGASRHLQQFSVDTERLERLFRLAGWPAAHSFIQTLRNAARTKFRWMERVPGRSGHYTVTDVGRAAIGLDD